MSDAYNYLISLGISILLGALFSESLIHFCLDVYAKNGQNSLHIIILSRVAYVKMVFFLRSCMYVNTNS